MGSTRQQSKLNSKQIVSKVFSAESVKTIEAHYRYHGNMTDLYLFEALLKRKYEYRVDSSSPISRMISPYEQLADIVCDELGRNSWAYVDLNSCSCHLVYRVSDSFFFNYSKMPLLRFDDEYCSVEGYEASGDSFHILKIESKKSSIVTFKKIKSTLNMLKSCYESVTATCASGPDRYTGMQNDWRFKVFAASSTRLKEYWKRLGFHFLDRYSMIF